MVINQTTTIKISFDTKKKLDEKKVYRRETYEDIIIRILNNNSVNKKRIKLIKGINPNNKINSELNQELNPELKNN